MIELLMIVILMAVLFVIIRALTRFDEQLEVKRNWAAYEMRRK